MVPYGPDDHRGHADSDILRESALASLELFDLHTGLATSQALIHGMHTMPLPSGARKARRADLLLSTAQLTTSSRARLLQCLIATVSQLTGCRAIHSLLHNTRPHASCVMK